jgi:putative nucleotidyltransferase with HDIG domain
LSLVKEIVAQVDHLPAVPAVVHQVLTLVSDENFSYRDLMNTIRLDPGITAHVLRMCNSPYYGLSRKITSLQEALTYLGTNSLVQLILSSEMVSQFRKSQVGYRLTRGDLWHHSMACALLAQRLGEQVSYREPATLFTAALLHDVGKLILSEYVARQFSEIEALVRDKQLSFVEAERQVLGLDHALLGAAVAKKWNFPEAITVAIAYHHAPEKARSHHLLVNLVCLANIMCVTMGVGVGVSGLAAPVPGDLIKQIGLKPRDLDRLTLEIKDILDQAGEMLKMAD